MLQKITIQGINSKDYNGVDKRTGQPYTAKIVGIFDGQKWYSYFDRKGVANGWNKGDTMTFDVTTKTTQEGKLLYNINVPEKADILEERLDKMRVYLNGVDALLSENFPGWKDTYLVKQEEVETPLGTQVTTDTKPLNTDELIEGVSNFNKEKNDDRSGDEVSLW